ncbi:MAG: hypothetical protein V4864_12695 [Pseudomonadota bacterium]
MTALDNETLILLVGLAVVALFIGAWLFNRKRQSEALEKRFGPEYSRAVDEMGSRPKAEAELLARQKRVEQLDIVALPPQEAARFSQSWTSIQARFVDNPQGALAEADQLVRELMLRRGYPMGDFDRRAADISVHHPAVVDHYRAAHTIAQRDTRGEADTEQLRQAVVHYRALFAELLQIEQPQAAAVRRDHVETH